MTAVQRGKVTTRQERGFGPISMKRLLLAGGVGVVLTMTLGRFVGPAARCAAGAAALGLLLLMTQPREGMPPFMYLLQALRGLLITTATGDRLGREAGWLARLLLVRPAEGVVDGQALFGAAGEDAGPQLDDPWVFLGADPDESGLERLAALPPLPGAQDGEG